MDITVGQSASISRTIDARDVELFAELTGDTNPVHLDDSYAAGTLFGRRIAHGLLVAGLISTVLGTKLPGPGAIYLGQTIRFLKPVFLGDTVTATVTVERHDTTKGHLTLSTVCANQSGETVLDGEAQILYRP